MTPTETILKMIFDRWYASIKNCDTLLESLSDETMQKEIAPGKNRGIYLLGHLIAVHDEMMQILGLGEKVYPELYEPFHELPDKAATELPTITYLRNCWTKQNAAIKQKFDTLKPEEWFEKHTLISPEDFVNEPHRNRLNVILTRTTHLQYHLGQMVLLK